MRGLLSDQCSFISWEIIFSHLRLLRKIIKTIWAVKCLGALYQWNTKLCWYLSQFIIHISWNDVSHLEVEVKSSIFSLFSFSLPLFCLFVSYSKFSASGLLELGPVHLHHNRDLSGSSSRIQPVASLLSLVPCRHRAAAGWLSEII